ncbi:hypothetical protein PRIP_10162 [Listeria riparia FSL S10-1204]|uniref:Uncharacterized protein n=1 Tax=Listeria riparia FSL S10-1204 TaxID=1265816 RepID=W7D4W7_9LIST|nr:hypothetical protein PRIP_10162 [Listeria riparia FSL S10-1204]
MVFAEAVKASKGWRVKLDPEALNMTPTYKSTKIIFHHKPSKGRQFHFIQINKIHFSKIFK